MSQAINPPSIYFNGINFNSVFYVQTPSSGSGFTETQANSLYLRKTIPDTATALETFNDGLIVTNTLDNNIRLQPSATIEVDNGANIMTITPTYIDVANNSPLQLGWNTNVGLSVGTGARTTAVVHHYSDGNNAVAGANVHLNNGTNNLSNTGIHNGANSGGQVNIATGSGSTTSTTIGGGSITINKPLTVGYTPPTDSLASLAFIGGTYKASSSFVYTISTTNRAFAPLNSLPNGRYLFKVYVFLGGNTPTEVIAVLCNSSSAITNSQSTGLNLIYDGNEAYCITSLTGRVSLNPVFLYDVVSPFNNIAIAVQSGINLSSANVFTINAIRIG